MRLNPKESVSGSRKGQFFFFFLEERKCPAQVILLCKERTPRMKRYTRIYIDMTEYVNVTVRNEDSHYACETELQTAPKLELEFHRRLSPSSSHSFRSF